MGRGKQEIKTGDSFSVLLGTRRGLNVQLEAQEEQEEKERDAYYLESLIIQPSQTDFDDSTPLSQLYDLEGIYQAGVTSESPLYHVLIDNLRQGILGQGMTGITRQKTTGQRLLLVTEDLKKRSSAFLDGPGKPVIEALSDLIEDGSVSNSQLNNMMLNFYNIHGSQYQPVMEAYVKRVQAKQENSEGIWSMVSKIIGSIEAAPAQSLDQELRPLVGYLTERLRTHKSLLVEYEVTSKALEEMPEEKLDQLPELIESIRIYRDALDEETPEDKILTHRLRKLFTS